MNSQRKVIFAITPILLILCFSTLLDLSSNRIGGSNHLSVSIPTVNEKIAGIQGIPIVITDNNGFFSAGFTGSGNETHPYVLDGNFYGKIEAGGPPGINISDTDAYFRIENMQINGSTVGAVAGVKLENVENGEIINTTITNSTRGFFLINSNHTSITESRAIGNSNHGFHLTGYCSFNNLTGNTAENNSLNGFLLYYHCNNNTLTNNIAINNTSIGFSLYLSHNNTLLGNIARENVFGYNLWNFCSFNNLTGNIAENNSQNGFVMLSSSNNNFYKGNIATNNTDDGFWLYNVDSNIFLENEVAKNGENGFSLDNASFNTFLENNATKTGTGFYLWDSSNNSLTKNTILDNDYGFDLDTTSNDNNLTHNLINNSKDNAILLQNFSNNNTLTWNTIEKTGYWSVKIDSSNDNLIYYNFFLDNNGGNTQGYDGTLTNSWDNGTHGNYWSDYTGNDIGNGIGNINYTVEGQPANDTKPLVFSLSLTGPGDLSFEAGSTDEDITWLPSTTFPIATTTNSFYTFYQDNNQISNGNWTSGGTFDVDLPVLGPGEYNFTVGITDSSGKTVVDTAIVTMIDTIHPVIIYTGSDEFSYEVNTPDMTLNVSISDLYPHTYILYQNGTKVNSSNWVSGVIIVFSLDDLSLPVGVYNFTLIVNDTSGNEATKTIIVTVSSAQTTTDTTTTASPTTTTTVPTTTPSSIAPAWSVPFTLFTLVVMVFFLSGKRFKRNE